MRVGINAIALLSPRTGIGQYIYHLGRELRAMQDVQARFFYAKHWSDELRREPVPRIDTLKNSIKRFIPRPYAVSRAILQTNFSLGLMRAPIDVYHEPNYLAYRFRGPTVVTVHDLSWIRHPETHPKERLDAMARYFPRSLERAAAIMTDCDFVRDELIEVFGVDRARIHPVLLGVSDDFRPHTEAESRAVLSAHGIEYGRYFLSVGTLEPRKNIVTLIDAFSMLPEDVQRRCPLVLVGMRGWLTSSIEAKIRPLVDKGLVKPLGYVQDEDMPILYSGATAFVFPSLYEGFGLPPLEAMACGAPVISSRTSSLPEVVGDAGMLVEPLDADAIAAAMRQLGEDAATAGRLAKLGVARAAGFTWRRTAEQSVAVYRRVLAG